jgi:hypothetical protein
LFGQDKTAAIGRQNSNYKLEVEPMGHDLRNSFHYFNLTSLNTERNQIEGEFKQENQKGRRYSDQDF